MTESETAMLERLRGLHDARWPAEIPREPHYPFGEIPLGEYLRGHARAHPDRLAIGFYGRDWTYEDLDRDSDRCAALLHARGVRPGERVAVLLPNCPQFLIAFYGILKLGCVHVPVNPLFKEIELAYELIDSGAVAIVALDALMPLVRAVRPRTLLRSAFVTSIAEVLPAQPAIPVPPSVAQPRIACSDAEDFLPALAGMTDAPPHVDVGLDDVAGLNYTGGTTGMPKGCAHTQRHMLYTAACGTTIGVDLAEGDVGICFVPVFWIAGEDLGVLFPIFSGTSIVLLARWDAVAFAAAIERDRVTFAYLLVDNAVEMLDRPETAGYDLSSLRRTSVSSFVKKLTVAYRDRWRERTGTTLVEAAWGMTETHTMDTFTRGMQQADFDLQTQPIFVGLPMPGTEFLIRDFESGALVPVGVEGEICVRTPSLLSAYWRRPDETAAALRDGWLHTGDIGAFDAQGYLHFLGRRKEMLKYRGMSVFPAEIEALLGQHPAVVGSGVIGRADDVYGEVPVAFVVIEPQQRSSIDRTALEAWCRERFAAYKVPEVVIVDALPLTATGKVKKDELAARLPQRAKRT